MNATADFHDFHIEEFRVKRFFTRVFNKLCGSVTLPSANITSKRATRRTSEEVESILDLEENDATIIS